MQTINRQLRLLFGFALALSIGFPAGILGIVFGANKGIVPLLVAGIILTVVGFYVMPILWIKYAEKRQDRSLLFMIEHEHLYTVNDLCTQTGYNPVDVRAKIKRMILSRVLVGYLFRNDTLECNTNEKQTTKSRRTKKCKNCGAPMVFDGTKFFCDYCLNTDDATSSD